MKFTTKREFTSSVNIGDFVSMTYSPAGRLDQVQDTEGYVARLGPWFLVLSDDPVEKEMGFFESMGEDGILYGCIVDGYKVRKE